MRVKILSLCAVVLVMTYAIHLRKPGPLALMIIPSAIFLFWPTSKRTRPPSYKALKGTPKGFEIEVARLFERLVTFEGQRLRAEVVGGAGDGGIDVKLWDCTGMLVGIVQAKYYGPGKTIPPSHIRDLDSVRRRMGVRAAWLVTTAQFSTKSRHLAAECRIKLIDGREFEHLQKRAKAA